MNKRVIFLLVTILLLGSLAPAQDGKRLRPNLLNSLRFGLHMAENNLFEARFILRLKDGIGLSAQQEQKIGDLMLAYEESSIRRGSDIKVLELKFAALLKGNRIDRRQMEKMAREIGNKRTDLQVDHLNYLLDVRDVLTGEQIAKLEKMKRNFRPNLPGARMNLPGRMPPPPPPDGDEPGPETESD